MTELMLDRDFRLTLRAQAHAIAPVVLLGAAGLTGAVLSEIDRALQAHGLIKVRVPLDERAEREAVFAAIAGQLGAARVQSIGKLIVLYRPPPPDEETAAPARAGTRPDARAARRAPAARKRQT